MLRNIHSLRNARSSAPKNGGNRFNKREEEPKNRQFNYITRLHSSLRLLPSIQNSASKPQRIQRNNHLFAKTFSYFDRALLRNQERKRRERLREKLERSNENHAMIQFQLQVLEKTLNGVEDRKRRREEMWEEYYRSQQVQEGVYQRSFSLPVYSLLVSEGN
eukprot:TRINITY_DN10600_c0_g1_i1.p1 TRINITY_DN10600_c0_g1~~TRINITY_DN10600_c0_g1_i1.p1  ORF type:complete len:162 (+),score=45.86 TRINITY_DN10600_c0_g1_i1:59-544(+)